MSRVLIVEDEQHLADGLRFNLETAGYQVQVVATGEAALEVLAAQPAPADVVVLDVMLPGKDGFTVMSEMRQAGQFIPTLILTARGHPADVLKGFASGADDYIAKPFELPILLARLQGLLRRREWMQHTSPQPGPPPGREAQTQSEYEFGRFTVNGRIIDFGNLELHAKGKITRLTVMEAELLRYLIRSRGRVVSRKSILEQVWGLREDTDTRAIDNFIVRLRRYLEDNPAHPKYLLTVRGVGYKFKGETAAAQVGEQKTGGR